MFHGAVSGSQSGCRQAFVVNDGSVHPSLVPKVSPWPQSCVGGDLLERLSLASDLDTMSRSMPCVSVYGVNEPTHAICSTGAGSVQSEPADPKSEYCYAHFRDWCFGINFRRNDACQPEQGLCGAARCCPVMHSAYLRCSGCGWLTDGQAMGPRVQRCVLLVDLDPSYHGRALGSRQQSVGSGRPTGSRFIL